MTDDVAAEEDDCDDDGNRKQESWETKKERKRNEGEPDSKSERRDDDDPERRRRRRDYDEFDEDSKRETFSCLYHLRSKRKKRTSFQRNLISRVSFPDADEKVDVAVDIVDADFDDVVAVVE